MYHHLRKPRNRKIVIMAHSVTTSKWTGPLVNITKIEITGAEKTDVVKIHQRARSQQRDPIEFRGSGELDVIIPAAELQIERVSGKSPITVYVTTRETNGTPAPAGHDLGTTPAA